MSCISIRDFFKNLTNPQIFNYQLLWYVQYLSFWIIIILICLTHASNNAAGWRLRCLCLKAGVLLFAETDVEAHIQGVHDVLRTRVQQYILSVVRTDSNETDAIPTNERGIYISLHKAIFFVDSNFTVLRDLMQYAFFTYSLIICIKGGISEALSLILRKEDAFFQNNAVHFISGAFPINSVPVLRRMLTLSAEIHTLYHV